MDPMPHEQEVVISSSTLQLILHAAISKQTQMEIRSQGFSKHSAISQGYSPSPLIQQYKRLLADIQAGKTVVINHDGVNPSDPYEC